MRKLILSMMCLFIVAAACSCSNKSAIVNCKNKENIDSVTNEVSFNVMDSQSKPLSDVRILIINMNGDVIGTESSDKNGRVIKKLTVPIDKRYYWADPDKIEPRGTVTAIAFKEGYREQVLLEVPVSPSASPQEIYLKPIVSGERNEPDVQSGYSHHIEIMSLVNKYSKYLKK
jgi:hypothetical protein